MEQAIKQTEADAELRQQAEAIIERAERSGCEIFYLIVGSQRGYQINFDDGKPDEYLEATAQDTPLAEMIFSIGKGTRCLTFQEPAS